MLQGKSVHDMQIERTKMLQKPTERPIVIDDDSGTRAFLILAQINTANHATFPIQIYTITV